MYTQNGDIVLRTRDWLTILGIKDTPMTYCILGLLTDDCIYSCIGKCIMTLVTIFQILLATRDGHSQVETISSCSTAVATNFFHPIELFANELLQD